MTPTGGRPPSDGWYASAMVAAEFTTDVLPFVVVGGIALVIAAWLVLTRVFSSSRAGRHASHFLDAGDADMPPEQRAKYMNNHPGAGGGG